MKNFLIIFAIGYYARAIQKSSLAQTAKKALLTAVAKELPTKTPSEKVAESQTRYDQGLRGV